MQFFQNKFEYLKKDLASAQYANLDDDDKDEVLNLDFSDWFGAYPVNYEIVDQEYFDPLHTLISCSTYAEEVNDMLSIYIVDEIKIVIYQGPELCIIFVKRFEVNEFSDLVNTLI